MNELNEFEVLTIMGASFVDKKLALYSDKGVQYARYLIKDDDPVIRSICHHMLHRAHEERIKCG
jgi:hypothetical protein